MSKVPGVPPERAARKPARSRKILVIDDSVMLLNFVKEILGEANYQVVATATAEEGLRAATDEPPDLILLDYVLPDMKGDEVLARLLEQSNTAQVPVVYMSGFGTDLKADPTQNPNVIGSLNKPFTSELLLKTVESFMPKDNDTSASDMDDSSESRAGGTGDERLDAAGKFRTIRRSGDGEYPTAIRGSRTTAIRDGPNGKHGRRH